MNGRGHFVKFKRLHRAGMSVAEIAAGRFTSSNGNGAHKEMQGTKHLPKRLPLTMRWREHLKKGWLKVVAKTEGRYSVSQGLGLVIIAASLSYAGVMYTRSQDQHDKIIKLETTIDILQKMNVDRDSKIDQAMNWGQSAKGDVKYLQGKFDQFAVDYAVKNAKNNGGIATQ